MNAIVLDRLKERLNIDANYTTLLWGEMETHRGSGKISIKDYKNSRLYFNVQSFPTKTFVPNSKGG